MYLSSIQFISYLIDIFKYTVIIRYQGLRELIIRELDTSYLCIIWTYLFISYHCYRTILLSLLTPFTIV